MIKRVPWLGRRSYEDTEGRRVALDVIEGVRVSTVFLEVDHNFSGDGPPILYETMLSRPDGEFMDWQRRYCTREEAQAGHAEALEWVRGEIDRLRPKELPG